MLEYLRVSTYKQKQDVTIETQIRENNKYKAIHPEIVIVATYKDDGRSGFKFGKEQRPDFNKLLDHLYSDDTVDGVFSYDLDRIGRDATELMILGREFVQKQKRIITSTKGEIKQDTPEGKLFYGIFSLWSEYDGNNIKRKFFVGRERKKAKNLEKGLPENFGFGRKPKIVPREVKEKIMKWYKKGYGFKRIQKRMITIPYMSYNEETKEYETTQGFKLSTSTLGKKLRVWGIGIRPPKSSKGVAELKQQIRAEVEKEFEQTKEAFVKRVAEKFEK